ncbi:hypothetical protein EVAR_67660_1 [Eumeta japonica]|uniref:Uncharacterized protein n=1 Tax=Eumeta variegata TaxID=151549 RepID=A0A4C1Z5G1_EUMVA|nr:hypothetical protein EVAR_67660_1 [Eumeta japonica]
MVSGLSRRRALAGAGGAYGAIALVLVGLAAWQWVMLSQVTALRNAEMHHNEENAEWTEVAPGLTLVGALVTIAIAVVAGFASRSKERRALIIFATCCACATIVLIVLGSLIVTKTEQPQIETYVKLSLYDTFHPMRTGSPAATEAFGAAENALGCCGVNDPREYHWWGAMHGGETVPKSCCDDSYSECEINGHKVTARLGCATVATEYIRTAYRWAGAGVLLAGCLCALGPALAWTLYVTGRPARVRDEPPDSDVPGDD